MVGSALGLRAASLTAAAITAASSVGGGAGGVHWGAETMVDSAGFCWSLASFFFLRRVFLPVTGSITSSHSSGPHFFFFLTSLASVVVGLLVASNFFTSSSRTVELAATFTAGDVR